MANYSRDDVRLSQLTGGLLSPSQVRNCKSARLGPDGCPDSTWWPALAQLLAGGKSFGPGRFDLAALEMARAGQGGCERLREALRGRLLSSDPDPVVFTEADDLVEAEVRNPSFLVSRIKGAAGTVAAEDCAVSSTVEGYRADTPAKATPAREFIDSPAQLQDATLRAALLPFAQVVTDESVEADDCHALYRILSVIMDAKDPDTGQDYTLIDHVLPALELAHSAARTVVAWIDGTPLRELAEDVVAGAEFYEAIAALGMFGDVSTLSEEHRWRLMLWYAVVARPLCKWIERVVEQLRHVLGPQVEMPSPRDLAAEFRAVHSRPSPVAALPIMRQEPGCG